MPRCKNDPARSYNGNEPSPKGIGYCAHAEPTGARRVGRDGAPWVVATDANGRRFWKPAPSNKAAPAPAGDDAQERCVRGFARYEKKDGRIVHVLQGQREDGGQDGRLRLRDGSKVVDVPGGYRRVGVRRAWLLETFCKPSVDEGRVAGAVLFPHWLDKANALRGHWLTLKDARVMARGGGGAARKASVFAFHRNTGDRSADSDVNPRGRAVQAARFFRLLRCSVALEAANGDALFAVLRFPDADPFRTALHVEYKPGMWFPLDEHGYLPAADPQSAFRLLGRKVHWTDMPPSTRIGWRGGFLRPEALAHLPAKVFYV